MSSTEEDILSTMPELGDETPYNDDAEGSTGPQDADSSALDGGTTEPVSESEQQSTQQQSSTTDPQQQESNWFGTDEKGNFIDARGNVAIAAGHARRVFEQTRREHREELNRSAALRTEIEGLQRTQQEARLSQDTLNGVPAQMGLNEEDVRQALRFWVDIKASPQKAVTELVAHARTAGHNIDGVGQVTDPAAIKAAITEVMGPLLGDRERSAALETQRTEVQQQVQTFFAENNDATIHEGALAAMIQQGISPTLQKAYTDLKVYAARNQLDWSRPLNGQGPRQQPTNGNGVTRTTNDPSLVSGHSVGSAGAAALNEKDGAEEFASPDASWRSILESVMPRGGIS